MKKLFGMAAIAVAMSLPLAAVAAPSVYFVPADQGVPTSSSGSVQVWVAGSTVGSFDLNISASNANLVWTGAIYSPSEPLGSTAGSDPDADFSYSITGNDINVIGFSWLGALGDPVPAAQTDPFLLFTLAFDTGAATGNTNLSFVSLGDPELGTNITDWDGTYQRTTTFGTACVNVGGSSCNGGTSVPEPGSYSLAGIALLAAGWAGRTRRRKEAIA